MGMKRVDRIDGSESYRAAVSKAKYGTGDWIYWRDAQGGHAARKSPATVKEMLLAVGTKGNWSLICAGGIPMKGFWWLGLNLLRQMKLGMY